LSHTNFLLTGWFRTIRRQPAQPSMIEPDINVKCPCNDRATAWAGRRRPLEPPLRLHRNGGSRFSS
jgi:hypothetical protein